MADPQPPAWTFAYTQYASDVLVNIRKSGSDKLHDDVVRYLRALKLEIIAAIRARKRLPGTRIADGRYAVDVPRETILAYYMIDHENLRIVVTDILWV